MRQWLLAAVLMAGQAAPAYAQDQIRVLETRVLSGAADRSASQSLRLSAYVFRGGRWSPGDAADAVTQSMPLLAQCGVTLSAAELRILEAPRRFRVYSTSVSRELLRSMPVRKPAIFFVDDTSNDPPFDAEAIGRANAASRLELADTIWVAHGARDLPQVLAHELVHVLSDSGEHSDIPGNLMRDETAPDDTRLTADQCERLRLQGTASGLLTSEANEGVVVSVDNAASEIVIRHGRLNGLDMPPMTMVFAVKDVRLLGAAKAGDSVRFAFAILDARFTVTQIRRR